MVKIDPVYNTPPNDPLFVECKNTPLERKQMPYYLREAWKTIYGEYPSSDILSILYAQTVLESGGKLLRNNNWGNIKKREGMKYTSYECGEYLKGKFYRFYPYHYQTMFVSWNTTLDGAIGYIKFLSNRSRYKKAWSALLKGDPTRYTIELKNGGYFTAPVSHYLKLILKLVKEYKSNEKEYLAWKPIEEIPVKEEPIENVDPKIDEPKPLPEIKDEDIIIIDSDDSDVLDIVPAKNDKERLSTIYNIFFTAWGYILKAIAFFKKFVG